MFATVSYIDQFKQYPKRDDELMHSLKLLAAGDSSDFMVRLRLTRSNSVIPSYFDFQVGESRKAY